jgi:hypothetical protein
MPEKVLLFSQVFAEENKHLHFTVTRYTLPLLLLLLHTPLRVPGINSHCVSGSSKSPVVPHQFHVVHIDIWEHYYYKILNDFPILIDMLKPTESALGLQADQLVDVLRKLPTLLLYRFVEMSEMSFVLSKAF